MVIDVCIGEKITRQRWKLIHRLIDTYCIKVIFQSSKLGLDVPTTVAIHVVKKLLVIDKLLIEFGSGVVTKIVTKLNKQHIGFVQTGLLSVLV